MSYKLTKKQIIKEVVTCGKDPVYFINTYCKIPHPGKGLIPFKTYDFQKDLVENLALHRFLICLKGAPTRHLHHQQPILHGLFCFIGIKMY